MWHLFYMPKCIRNGNKYSCHGNENISRIFWSKLTIEEPVTQVLIQTFLPFNREFFAGMQVYIDLLTSFQIKGKCSDMEKNLVTIEMKLKKNPDDYIFEKSWFVSWKFLTTFGRSILTIFDHFGLVLKSLLSHFWPSLVAYCIIFTLCSWHNHDHNSWILWSCSEL